MLVFFLNLGCGAFGGDPQLKSLIQLMAAAENGNFTKKKYPVFGNGISYKKLFNLFFPIFRS